MFVKLGGHGAWSMLALRFLILSIVMCVLLSILDGVLHGPLREDAGTSTFLRMFIYWTSDFRYVFEQGMLAAVVLFVGAKFFETRTIMTVGFDQVDGSKIAVKGPDDDNVVWIGRRYGSPFEAQAVATTLAEQISAGQETA
jgi:hypothetical protein